MDSYIVRIYRRNGEYPERINGVVELVEQQELQSFHSIDELARILAPELGASPTPSRKPPSPCPGEGA